MRFSYLYVLCALLNAGNRGQVRYEQEQVSTHSQGAFDLGICFATGTSLLITAYAQYMDIFLVHC